MWMCEKTRNNNGRNVDISPKKKEGSDIPKKPYVAQAVSKILVQMFWHFQLITSLFSATTKLPEGQDFFSRLHFLTV